MSYSGCEMLTAILASWGAGELSQLSDEIES